MLSQLPITLFRDLSGALSVRADLFDPRLDDQTSINCRGQIARDRRKFDGGVRRENDCLSVSSQLGRTVCCILPERVKTMSNVHARALESAASAVTGRARDVERQSQGVVKVKHGNTRRVIRSADLCGPVRHRLLARPAAWRIRQLSDESERSEFCATAAE